MAGLASEAELAREATTVDALAGAARSGTESFRTELASSASEIRASDQTMIRINLTFGRNPGVQIFTNDANAAKQIISDPQFLEDLNKLPTFTENGLKNARDLKTGEDGKIEGNGDAAKDAEATTSSRLGKFKQYLGELLPSGKTILLGVAVVTIIAFISTRLDGTDGVSASITELQIVSSSSEGTIINVSYQPPGAYFTPAVNDDITFNSSVPSLAKYTGKITSIVSSATIQVLVSGIQLTTFPPMSSIGGSSIGGSSIGGSSIGGSSIGGSSIGGSSIGGSSSAAPGTILSGGNLGQFTDHTSFINQTNGLFTNMAGVATQAMTTVLDDAASAAVDAIDNAKKVGSAAAGALCDTIPFVCHWDTWVIVAVIIIVLIIIFFSSSSN
jgi:hypothetical protein